jgi:hypothetical protein
VTLADTIRHQVLTLDANGIPASHIAHALRIPVARVDRILDDHDAEQGVPHPERIVAPVLEPLGGPAVIVSQAAVGGGRDNDPTRPKRQPREQQPRQPRERQRKEPQPQHPPKEIECGTLAGYYQHRRNGTPTCTPCKAAYNAYDRQIRPRKTDTPYLQRKPVECGTYLGRGRHKLDGTPVCEPCRVAYNEWQRQQYAIKGAVVKKPRKPINHGTPAGYRAHGRRGEKACDECRLAYNESKRKTS